MTTQTNETQTANQPADKTSKTWINKAKYAAGVTLAIGASVAAGWYAHKNAGKIAEKVGELAGKIGQSS